MKNLVTGLILFVCFTFFTKTLIAQENQEEGVQLFARIGNGIVVGEAKEPLSLGIGLEHQMSRRWAFRAEVGYDWSEYDESFGIEREILSQEGKESYTSAVSVSVSAIHYWSIGASARHQIGIGIGVAGRIFQWQGVTEYVVSNRFDRAPIIEDLIRATINKQEEDMASLLLGAHYKTRLTNKLGLGAFCRYDLNAGGAQDRSLTSEISVDESRRQVGGTNKTKSFVDGPRAVTLGFQMFYTF